MADKIAEVRADPLISGVFILGNPAQERTSDAFPNRPVIDATGSPLSETSALRAEIAALNKQVERLSRTRNKGNTRRGYSKSPYRRRTPNRQTSHRFDNLCFYHSKFGKEARKCQQPCSFQESKHPEN